MTVRLLQEETRRKHSALSQLVKSARLEELDAQKSSPINKDSMATLATTETTNITAVYRPSASLPHAALSPADVFPPDITKAVSSILPAPRVSNPRPYISLSADVSPTGISQPINSTSLVIHHTHHSGPSLVWEHGAYRDLSTTEALFDVDSSTNESGYEGDVSDIDGDLNRSLPLAADSQPLTFTFGGGTAGFPACAHSDTSHNTIARGSSRAAAVVPGFLSSSIRDLEEQGSEAASSKPSEIDSFKELEARAELFIECIGEGEGVLRRRKK